MFQAAMVRAVLLKYERSGSNRTLDLKCIGLKLDIRHLRNAAKSYDDERCVLRS